MTGSSRSRVRAPLHRLLSGGLLSTLLMLQPLQAATTEVGGTSFASAAEVAGQPVVLNGAGLRTFVILNVYAAGLYVPHRETTAEAVLSQPGAKSIKLVLLRNLTSDEFTHALVKGFRANQSTESLPKLQSRLDELTALMLSFGEAKKGWTVEISYLPGIGTRFLLNGKHEGKDIPGEDFYQALLRIWLGHHPVDSALKRALLGSTSS